jgi:hypothetical protein
VKKSSAAIASRWFLRNASQFLAESPVCGSLASQIARYGAFGDVEAQLEDLTVVTALRISSKDRAST